MTSACIGMDAAVHSESSPMLVRSRILLPCALIIIALAHAARAQQSQRLSLEPDVDTVYAPPEPEREDSGVNEGGVNLNFDFRYMTDYIFRGVDRSESGGAEDSPNLQFDTQLTFNLGRFPHPFIGVFSNIYDSDPISRFQEIRPYFGLELNVRPILFQVGHSSFIFPDRDRFNTNEIWAKMTLDDSYFFRTDQPILRPSVLLAYDYDVNHGAYLELGVSHDFAIEDTPITITPVAHIAYSDQFQMFVKPTGPVADPAFDFGASGHASGLQHYDVGLVVTYALNQSLHIPQRYGTFDIKGFLFYTDGIDNDLRADTEIYGGFGLSFSY
jgi:hypothetical protein